MLSYKHGYHAGNNADVFKHICLLQAYKTLKKHHNSISYIDTHAGSGIYKFDSDDMSKNKEYLGGISKLEDYKYDNISIKYFLKVLKNINNSKKLLYYPGSPSIMSCVTDNFDRLSFYELHNNEFKLLRKNLSKKTNSKFFNKDGFNFINQKIDKNDKTLVLIDPSYEIKDDYNKVINFIKTNYEKLENKILLIWYPIINRMDTNLYIDEFKKTGIKNILRIEMPIQKDNEESGMTGSGLIILNAHKKTPQSLRGTIKELQSFLQIKNNKKRIIVNFLR